MWVPGKSFLPSRVVYSIFKIKGNVEMIVVGNIVSQVKREMSNSGFIVGTVFSEIENYFTC